MRKKVYKNTLKKYAENYYENHFAGPKQQNKKKFLKCYGNKRIFRA